MRFAINVGLNVKGSENSDSEVDARAHIAHLAIGGFISHRGSWTADADINIDGDEPTLVVKGWLSRISIDELKRFLSSLSVALSQDCIAVAELDKDNGRVKSGWLVGPKASEWGEFNPTFFQV